MTPGYGPAPLTRFCMAIRPPKVTVPPAHEISLDGRAGRDRGGYFHVDGRFAVIRVGAGIGTAAGMHLRVSSAGNAVAKPKVVR